MPRLIEIGQTLSNLLHKNTMKLKRKSRGSKSVVRQRHSASPQTGNTENHQVVRQDPQQFSSDQ